MMISRIVGNTPLWVWGLLLALLWLGFSQVRARSVGLGRSLILPLAMTVLSLSETVSSFGASPPVMLAWAVAAGVALWLVVRLPVPSGTRYESAAGMFHLPGSWSPLMLILGIFSIKYAVGASLSMQPALAHNAAFAIPVAALYGVLAGVFIARTGRLLRLRRNAARSSGTALLGSSLP